MTVDRHARAPWVLWAVAMLLLAATLTLVAINRGFAEDAAFLPMAVAMVTGYSTVGAVLASRSRRNVLGWLMIGIGFAFVTTGITSEYVTYAYETSRRTLPFTSVSALISELLWLPTLSAVALLVALYPTGRVPTRRWRFLPRAMVLLLVLYVAGETLRPRLLDVGAPDVANPFAIGMLEPVAQVTGAVGAFGLLIAAPLCIAALVLRYRRSSGEERQQIRWLVYIAAIVGAVVTFGIASNLIVGHGVLENVLFNVTFALIGIGVPVAMGVAILKYRLYDLDVVIKKTVLYAIVAGAFTLIAYLIVLAVPTLLVGLDAVPVVLLAPVLALAFLWIRGPATRLADRIVYGGRATPYEVLSDFSERMGGTYSTEDVLPRMAQLVGDATGARTASVWLRVGEQFRPLATWPTDADPPRALDAPSERLPDFGGDVAFEIRHQGELLGALTLSARPNDPMDAPKERLVRDLAAQAGLVLRNVGLIEDLRASRERLVAAQDAERRRIERNIHDGAQQQLVALAVKQRLAVSFVGKEDDRLRSMLEDLQRETTETLENLRDLARGIYPPLLADEGLAAALEAQARKSTVPVVLDPDGVGRYRQETEAAVYFCVLEALQNVSKYAKANEVQVTLGETNGDLTFAVQDDGVGFDPETARGSGLTNMRDRVEAVGGNLTIRSAPGRGTVVEGRIAVTGGGAA